MSKFEFLFWILFGLAVSAAMLAADPWKILPPEIAPAHKQTTQVLKLVAGVMGANRRGNDGAFVEEIQE